MATSKVKLPKETHVFGWNRDESFEVARARSTVYRGMWWVCLRTPDYQWWHSEAKYTEQQAKALFDHFCSLSGDLLRRTFEELKQLEAESKLEKGRVQL